MRAFCLELLRAAPFAAYRWELPALTRDSLGWPLEFAFIDCPMLERAVDCEAFSEHFGEPPVATFSNLGGDAILVAPRPQGDSRVFGHLGAFVRSAPDPLCHELLGAVGRAFAARVSERPVWLSTAGMGVAWLHVRLDDFPKYYAHQPYRVVSARD